MTRTRRQRWCTAVHEAGHAVVALHERREFRDVVIDLAGRATGMVRDLQIDLDDDDHVRISLAGAIAHRLRVRAWHPRIFEHADDDLGSVATHFRPMESTRTRILLTWNIEHTRDILVERWGAVERVANALTRARILTIDEIRRLMELHDARPHSEARQRRSASWNRMIEHILWRVENPGSLAEARAAVLARLAGDDRDAV